MPDETGTKANLYATLGPQDKPGIILSGHTDVVPIDGQDWHTDPFDVQLKDGKLYGRGTCDMKSFVAICLAYAPKFLERGLNIPIHPAFSHDEEVGCIGVPQPDRQAGQRDSAEAHDVHCRRADLDGGDYRAQGET